MTINTIPYTGKIRETPDGLKLVLDDVTGLSVGKRVEIIDDSGNAYGRQIITGINGKVVSVGNRKNALKSALSAFE